jgi:hypothetical protein
MTNKMFETPFHPPKVIKQEPPVKLREFRLSKNALQSHKIKHDDSSKDYRVTIPICKNSKNDPIKIKNSHEYDYDNIDLVDKLVLLINLLKKTKV